MSVKLSRRLQTICDLVPQGSRICDVGCDHALVDIYLLQEEKITGALAMDVAAGPLAIARQNLELAGVAGRCAVRLSDGLQAYQPGEADTLIIAGMGGILMQKILEAGSGKATSFRQLILSPQSEPWLVREWLQRNDIGITEEKLIEEDGKYYPILFCRPNTHSIRPDWPALAAALTASARTSAGPGSTASPSTQTSTRPGSARTTAGSPSSIQDIFPLSTAAAILEDPSFQREAEAEYGPVLLSRKDPVLREYLVKKLRADLAIRATLLQNTNSTSARARLTTIQAEAGRLQLLLLAVY